MRIHQILCISLALMLSSCASWHQPGLVYRGGSSSPRSASTRDIVLRTPLQELEEDDADRPSGPQTFDLDSPTLTPPIESVSHRTGYRGQPERARPVRKPRPPVNPPGLGFIELPPPPDLD